ATTKKVLIDAVKRGVDVRIILPSWSDSNLTLYAGRSHYDDFLDAGIKIYELQKGMLHAKTAVIDGVWSTVGSTNIDMWSFMRNNEINAVIVSLEFARDMENLFNTDLAASKEITRKDWSRRPIWNRLAELVGRLMSHWL
ncbi:MAG TPA: phospholipase D-like domain-containing protein, partial [Syntrophorhabdaceae bacterium]|nr:phospholipase D-like domain-containing protein [Syntrophorhabdaceae bacterium]